jgi:AcrR family transcriptional regulator
MSTPEATGAATAPKRGRPPNPEAVARRKRELIVAAYAVFSARGYTAAGVADIAEQLGIGHGTFYRYFQSKRDVLDHVVDYGVERVVDAIGREARPDSAMSLDALMDQLRDNAERLFGLLDAEPGLARVILLEAPVVDRELTERIVGIVDAFGATTAACLVHGMRVGFVRPGLNAAAVGRGIDALLLPSVLSTLRGEVDRPARRELSEGLIDFIRAGIEAR